MSRAPYECNAYVSVKSLLEARAFLYLLVKMYAEH
jgi:hypothetical protein